MAEDAADATLELTLLSADGLKESNFLGKSRPVAVAWVDPGLKKSTKTSLAPSHTSTQQRLHLPLSPQTLRNPTSCLTVQILSSLLPFRVAKPAGTAILPLSSVPFAGEALTLPLRRPSGRPCGSLRVYVRILWCLGAAPPADCVAGVAPEVDACHFLSVHPTAPPMPDGQCAATGALAGLESPSLLPIDPTALPLLDEHSAASENLVVAGVSGEVDDPDSVWMVDRPARPVPEGHRALRSFLMGLVSGTVAAVLVGVAGLSEG